MRHSLMCSFAFAAEIFETLDSRCFKGILTVGARGAAVHVMIASGCISLTICSPPFRVVCVLMFMLG